MPLAGTGMLLTSMDIDPADELDFNRWYDREHLIERVAIDGFVEARRYVAHRASPKYLSLYSTESFEVLSSAAYNTALANQTAWSTRNIGKFRNMIRGVARISASRGHGRGACLGLIRIRPGAGDADSLRAGIIKQLAPELHDGIISMHLLENDPTLSKPLTGDTEAPGAGDWYVLVDGTSPTAVEPAVGGLFDAVIAASGATLISAGIYTLLWDLAKAEI
ncbi:MULTISPECIES: DUF4286 family protein [Rhodopseudomonas]|uniref:Uncharacterized protein n=1 Tax=Rhodopseudomonas palustris TaxID=1076 RepID=A0A0D7E5C2_RHOPL|nr:MULTISPECIES: DUF4286 family protein [Rhodopseudomonas]KIZ36073.1 hypothetical protein OO17_25095 [Rhodopseudomonas palustris]MDF3809665.1 hypothetical protein [Rhodopseudomonas sp. BAL398]WOK18227.1 DUF4286 family protein [Rhodopseudomonas sp. BAL398]